MTQIFKLFLIILLSFATCIGQSLTEQQRNVLHVSISAACTGVGCFGVDQLSKLSDEAVYPIGFTLGLIPGIAKECIDKHRGYDFSMHDILLDVSGCLVTSTTYYIIKKVKSRHDKRQSS